MGRRGTPDRWGNYKPLGERIDGTPFISFKCPLKESLVRNLPVQERFTTQVLMESVPNLGLVIDLTNTDRYYNKEDFLGQGIRYEKIFCRGHEIPSQSVVDKFFSAVDKYLESSSAENGDGKLIGVHCTHGLNRTGYLVCRYMIRKLGFSPEDAISAFEKARGYPMEREGYLKSLRENEESPKSPKSAGSQNNEDPVDSAQTNDVPNYCQDNWNDSGARDPRTDGFAGFSRNGNFQRYPTNVRSGGFGSFSRNTGNSSSWPYRNYRADFCSSFANSPRDLRVSSHPYHWEYDPEERGSRSSRAVSRRFYEQVFESMRQRRYDHRSRSSSSFFRDSVRHRNW